MTSSKSMTGQRLQQASAVPYQFINGHAEFCLITSRQSKLWVFPKGIVDRGETIEEAALKEAWEEAGLIGRIVGEPLGNYEYTKVGKSLAVTVVLMEVDESTEHWQEAHLRQRTWVSADEARELLTRDWLSELLETAIDRIALA